MCVIVGLGRRDANAHRGAGRSVDQAPLHGLARRRPHAGEGARDVRALGGRRQADQRAFEIRHERGQLASGSRHGGRGVVGALRIAERVVHHRRTPGRAAPDRSPRGSKRLEVIRRAERERRRGLRIAVGQTPERCRRRRCVVLLQPRDVATGFGLRDGGGLAMGAHQDQRSGGNHESLMHDLVRISEDAPVDAAVKRPRCPMAR